MRAFASLSFVLSLALSLPFVAAEPHGLIPRHHHAKRNVAAVAERNASEVHHFTKRFDNARFTFFSDGLGACGTTNGPNDFIVALNSAQYDGGSHCYAMITITVNGKTTQAQITDECPGCPYGGLDFSEGLFQFFADESAGVLTGTWNFGSGSPSTSSPPPPPPTTSYKPTSTWSPPPSPTSTPSPPPSSSTVWSSSSSSSSSVGSTSSATSSVTPTTTNDSYETTGSAVPTSASNPENLQQFNFAFIGISALIGAGAQSQ